MRRWSRLHAEVKMTDRELMILAIDESRKSVSERYDPYVGAVIARKGNIIATGFRGEISSKHAEGSALHKIENDAAVGADVFTTLEPCTARKTHTPCIDLLLQRQVGRVVIGILDPNRDIRGEGVWRLEESHIKVDRFEPDLIDAVRAMNSDFIDYQRGLGIHISEPASGVSVEGKISLRGTFRMHPRPGDRIEVFNRDGRVYYPQAPISFHREQGTWQCEPIYLGTKSTPTEYELIVARLSDDLDVVRRHYSRVHSVTQQWIGIEMASRPSGFEVLASTRVTRAANQG
jgi:pyrimidine deaminase RibD-like protein